MLFFDVLPFTTLAVSVNGKSSKKSVQIRRGGVWCVKALKVLTHLKLPRHFCMLFFDVLSFTDDASVINGKTSKKSTQKRRGGFGVSKGLDTPKTAAFFFFCMLFFEVLPFTTLASSVNGKTSKKSMPKRRGGVWCVKA